LIEEEKEPQIKTAPNIETLKTLKRELPHACILCENVSICLSKGLTYLIENSSYVLEQSKEKD
jgi:hypothetical protein